MTAVRPGTGVHARGTSRHRPSAVRSILLMAGGAAVGQGLALAAAPVLSRLYSPADFGVFGVFIAVVTVLGVVGTFRYELAVPLADERGAVHLVLVGLLANVAVVAVLAAVLPAAGGTVARWAGAPQLAGHLWLLAPTLLATGTYQLLTFWGIRRREYRGLARRNAAYAAAQVGTQVGLGALGARPLGLLLGTAAAHGAGALTLARSFGQRAAVAGVSWRGMRDVARRYRRFPLFSTWSGLVNSAGGVVPVLLLAQLYGLAVAGAFTLTARVVGAPIGLLGEAVAQYYLGEAADLARHDRAAVRRLFRRSAARLFALGLVPLTVLALPAPWWFPAVFGEPWREAGSYAQVLLPMYLLQFAIVPLSQTLNLLERQHLQLLWDALRLALGVAALTVAHHLGASPVRTIAAYAVAMSVCYALLYLMAHRALSAPAAASRPGWRRRR
jgi:O-antigen/teichoic acid export membrane protein